MKKKTLGLIIAGVAAASMIGTGFAAWVITGNASGEQTGNFQVDTVTDKSITLTVAWATGEDGYVNFLGPETQDASNEWLAYDAKQVNSVAQYADLSETLTLTFGLGADVDRSEFTVTFEVENPDTFAGAVSAGYVVAPTINGNALDAQNKYSCTLDTLAPSGTTADVTIAYNWGAAFGSTNPYTFYNGIAYNTKVTKNASGTPVADANGTKTIQTVANEDLTALNTAFDGATFTLTITVAKTA